MSAIATPIAARAALTAGPARCVRLTPRGNRFFASISRDQNLSSRTVSVPDWRARLRGDSRAAMERAVRTTHR